MEVSNLIVSKFLLLLNNVKEALILDCQREFLQVREAIATLDPKEKSVTKILNDRITIINLVFAKIGYDISHYENLEDLGKVVGSLINEAEGLSEDLKKTIEDFEEDHNLDGDEVAAMLDRVVPRIISIVNLVKTISDIEWEKISQEFDKAVNDGAQNIQKQYLNKDFARKILDHILITLLKNAKDVFKDEIDFVKMTVENHINILEDSIEDVTKNIKSDIGSAMNSINVDEIESVLKETLKDAERLYDKVDKDLRSSVKDAVNSAEKKYNDAYSKLAYGLSITYSILDFLGVLKEKEINLQLPSQIKDLIQGAENAIQKASDNVKEGVGNITEQTGIAINKAQETLKVTQEITGVGITSLSTVGVQLRTLELFYNDKSADSGLETIKNGFDTVGKQAVNISKDLSSTIKGKLDSFQNFSYPIKVTILNWKAMETLFTHPVKHFKQLYPIDSVADAEDLMRRIMGILHNINPDIPNFDSLKNLLEDLLKKLQRRLIQLVNELKQKGKDLAEEIWEKFQPLITTIRKVIDMLKDMALALKVQMSEVLEEVKDAVKVVVDVVQDQLDEIADDLAGEIKEIAKDLNKAGSAIKSDVQDALDYIDDKTNEIKKELNEAGNAIDDAVEDLGDKASSVLGDVADEIRKAVGEMPSFNLPKAIKVAMAEPLTDAISDAFKKVKIDFDLSPFVELSNHKNDLVSSLKRIDKNVRKLNVEIPQLQLAGALPSFDTTFGTDFPDVLGIVQEEAIQPLQLWAYGIVRSVKTVTDVDVWKSRMDKLILQLQEEFKSDLGNITGLISKEGAMKLINDSASVKDQLSKELNINDYITILHTAVEDVVLPDPEYFYNSFKQTLQTILSNLTARLIKEYEGLKNKLNDNFTNLIKNFESGIDNFKTEVDNVKGQLGNKAKVLLDDINASIANVKDLIKKLEEVAKKIISLPSNIIDQLKNQAQYIFENLVKELVDGLEELASNIWRNIKTQVIMPLINHIKNQIIHCVKEIVRKVLNKLIESITEIKDEIDEATQTLLENLPVLRDFQKAQQEFVKEVRSLINKNQSLKAKIEDILPEGRITNLNQIPGILGVIRQETSVKQEFEKLSLTFQSAEGVPIKIPYYYVNMTQSMVSATLDFVQSDMSVQQIIKLLVSLYKGIPEEVKDKVLDILPDLPDLPDNAFTDLLGDVTYTYDLDNRMCNVTLLDLKPKDGKDAVDDEKNDLNYKLTLKLFMFVGVYGTTALSVLNEDEVDDEEDDDKDEGVAALYFLVHLGGNLDAVFYIGDNHFFQIELDGSIGDGVGKGNEVSNKSLGFCMTEKNPEMGITSVFHGLGSAKSLEGLFKAKFSRNYGVDTKKKAEPAKLLNTKYLDIKIGNYPQTLYLLYNHEYPEEVITALNFQGEDKKVDGFSAGYLAKLEDVEFILKLRQNKFFEMVLNDDIAAKFNLSLLYDYLRGFKIGGGYNFHIDLDCSNLNLGALNLQNLGVDIGSLKDDWGTLNLGIGSTFSVNFNAVKFSFENLGIAMNLNVIKPDFSIGDWDFGFKFKFPDGIGIAIETPVVNGAGLISYSEETGELLGVLELDVIDKFGVSALLLVDLGVVEGHFFSLVAMLSFRFSPGVPLGMGFSLTAIGGALGLQRMLDRKSITQAVRQGTLNSVFIVEDVADHLTEMKQACADIFPSKQGQFFLGLLAQISYEPVLKCNFGLMLQLPNPVEIIIVGALKVAIEKTDVIRINVYFAGGINFEEGIWFDASLVDSEIVGIKLEGDMAFRLFWGGSCKGFLLSIGGFHPNYKPEEGMLVSNMKRLALKLDYKVLKVGLEAYLAITSNSFQIGAHLDLKVGWNKFGITGYAGFDALFIFDPFMFMFDIEAGVAVVCGSWKLMSIDLSLSLSGPAPWNAKGDAKFWFILIPIEVGFNVTWGDSRPQLPDKEIEILPLLIGELKNSSNWMQEPESNKDRDVIMRTEYTEAILSTKDKPAKDSEKPLIVSPLGTLSFNQSIVPLEDKTLDMCNNAVPTDYNIVQIKYVKAGAEKITVSEKNHLENDFAPSLYYSMNNDQKLKSPSYVSYKSGFKAMGGHEAGNPQSLSLGQDVTIGPYKTSDSVASSNLTTSSIYSASPTPTYRTRTPLKPVTINPYTSELEIKIATIRQLNSRKVIAYQKKNKVAFDRYLDMLDNL